MKKIILTVLTLVTLSATPTVANPVEDFAAGLFFGTAPLLGHFCLYSTLRDFKKDGPKRAALAVPGSLAGTYIWHSAAKYFRNNYELETLSYIVPALPFILTMAALRAADAVHSKR